MRWYKSGVKFDDVPEKYRHQVNINSIPYNRRPGDEPALTDEDVDAIVAFLGTLTDAAYRNSMHREGKRKESPPNALKESRESVGRVSAD